jgi:hypothetical protein
MKLGAIYTALEDMFQEEIEEIILNELVWYAKTGIENWGFHSKNFTTEEMKWVNPMFRLVLPEDYERKTVLNPPTYWPRPFWGTP